MESAIPDARRAELWPLFGLRLATPRLELRLPTETELLDLVALAPEDLELDPSRPVPAGIPNPRAARMLQWYWRALGDWKVDHWRLPLAVWMDGAPVGFQELEAERFSELRTVETSSWLVAEARGLGVGKEMRAAVLSLAFDHLGAERAKSDAWEWNASSLGVSRSLGYADNGRDFEVHGDRRGLMQRVLLEKSGWQRDRWKTEVSGLDACRAWFGGS